MNGYITSHDNPFHAGGHLQINSILGIIRSSSGRYSHSPLFRQLEINTTIIVERIWIQ